MSIRSRNIFAALFLAGAFGAASSACDLQDPQVVGETQGYVSKMASGECVVDIEPKNTSDFRYRSYMFYEDGLLMAFSSYGKGTNSGTTGSREYYFFPRSGDLGLRMDQDAKTVIVTTADGGEVDIDPDTARIRSLRRGDAAVSSRVRLGDGGGLEIARYDGLMLEVGYAVGHSPGAEPDRESTFRSPTGHLCRVANRELFTYTGKAHDRAFKFSDRQLSEWLKTRCPGLRAGF